jgi:hypothetical protein
MPARPTQLGPSAHPLNSMAEDLRRLRSNAPLGRPQSVDDVVRLRTSTVKRAAIFSALAGKTVPSAETLEAMVAAWARFPSVEIARWRERRDACVNQLARQAEWTVGRSPARASGMVGAEVSRPFGAEVRRFRTAAGMSLTELAHRAHYSKGYLSKIENGEKPSTPELARMVDAALKAGGELAALLETGTP